MYNLNKYTCKLYRDARSLKVIHTTVVRNKQVNVNSENYYVVNYRLNAQTSGLLFMFYSNILVEF